MANDGSAEKLLLARAAAVEARRALVETLLQHNKGVLSVSYRRQLVELQAAIEAIDRAIADEKSMAKKLDHKKLDKPGEEDRDQRKGA